jgi:disulfide bond formation protein DsbB
MQFLQSNTFAVVNAYAVVTIVGQIIAIVLLVMLLREWITQSESGAGLWVRRHGILCMFIIALAATCGSLFFSEIAGWVPCKDCWFQRIFMYPQVVLLAVALRKKDRRIAPYILALCLIGGVISILHYTEQVQAALHPVLQAKGANGLPKPCDASGVSCASTQISFAYGYITLPMMALTAFIMNAIMSLLLMRRKGE